MNGETWKPPILLSLLLFLKNMSACGFILPAHNVAIFSAIKVVPSSWTEWNRPLIQGVPGRASYIRRHTTTFHLFILHHWSTLELRYCPLLSISFRAFPLPTSLHLCCFTSWPRLTPLLCQAKDNLSIWDITHRLNLFSEVSWGYPVQWLQANI